MPLNIRRVLTTGTLPLDNRGMCRHRCPMIHQKVEHGYVLEMEDSLLGGG